MNKQEIEKAIEDLTDLKNKTLWESRYYAPVELAISALEQQLNNGWISVSERLPEETDRYLVTYREWTDGNFLPKYDDTYVRIWRYRKDDKYTGFVYPTCLDFNAEKDTHRDVLAWQPLPEPYKGDRDESMAKS